MKFERFKQQSGAFWIPIIGAPVITKKEYFTRKNILLAILLALVIISIIFFILPMVSYKFFGLGTQAVLCAALAFALYWRMGKIISAGYSLSPITCSKCKKLLTVNPHNYEIIESEFEVYGKDGKLVDTRRDVEYLETVAKGNGVYESQVKTRQEGYVSITKANYTLKGTAKVKWSCPHCSEEKIVDVEFRKEVTGDSINSKSDILNKMTLSEVLKRFDLDFGSPKFGLGRYVADSDARPGGQDRDGGKRLKCSANCEGIFSYRAIIADIRNMITK